MIRSSDFKYEQNALDAMVDCFAAKMKEQLREKYDDGWSGWDDERAAADMKRRAAVQLEKGHFVDAANLAAMLDNFKD